MRCPDHPHAPLKQIDRNLTFDKDYGTVIRDRVMHCHAHDHNVELSDVLRQSGRALRRKYEKEELKQAKIDAKLTRIRDRKAFVSVLDTLPKRSPRRRFIRNYYMALAASSARQARSAYPEVAQNVL
jgi:hypothetical protein